MRIGAIKDIPAGGKDRVGPPLRRPLLNGRKLHRLDNATSLGTLSEQMHGRPEAWASIATIPRPSYRLGEHE